MKKGIHTSYRGTKIDMDAMRNENANVPAMGNMNANAKGDILGKGGVVTRTVDEIARENHRVRTAIKHTGLKGPQPEGVAIDKQKDLSKSMATGAKMPPRKSKEIEQENGDIVIQDDNE